MRINRHNPALFIAIIFGILLLAKDYIANFVNESISEVTQDDNSNLELTKDLEELLSKVEVIENDLKIEYDRDDYTSSSQYYEGNEVGEEYNSIKAYAYYESEYYNEENDSYICPYTNEVVAYENIDFDHIVPLNYAHNHGGSEWSEEEKKLYADDPNIGVNVNSSDNRSKGAKGPSEWLPDYNVEEYCYTWLIICDNYDISLSKSDYDTIVEILSKLSEEEFKSLDIINNYE